MSTRFGRRMPQPLERENGNVRRHKLGALVLALTGLIAVTPLASAEARSSALGAVNTPSRSSAEKIPKYASEEYPQAEPGEPRRKPKRKDGPSAVQTGTPFIFLAPSFINLPQSGLAPQNYVEPAMDLDEVRSKTILFGGCTTSTPCASNETWSFDGNAWTKLTPATSPPARYDATLTFNPATGDLVLFGGIGSSGQELGDTWVWNGTTWTQKTPATAPSARHGAHVAYLPSLGKVVLFGGVSGTTYHADTWTWNGTTWTNVTPGTSPPARAEGGLAYTGATAKLVLYGGRNGSGVRGDTWLFNGTSWTQQSPTASPGPLERFMFTYNPRLHLATLVGGRDDVSTYYPDLWVWDGTTWAKGGGNLKVFYTGYPGTIDAAMSRPPTNGQLVMVGGQAPTVRNGETYRIEYPNTGFAPFYNHQDARITDRSDDHANMANQGLVYRMTDLQVRGTGLDLVIERQQNNYTGYISRLLTFGWTMGVLDMVTYSVPDGSKLVIGSDGRYHFFSVNPDGTWTAPAGSDLTLVANPDGTRTLTELHQKVSYAFTNGYLTRMQDRNGNAIVFNRDASNKLTSITDTQGRNYTFAYNAFNEVTSITDPSGRSMTYAYDGIDLTSVTLSDPNDPVPAATTTYAYGSAANGWLDRVTTPAGRIVKYTLNGNMNRLSQIQRVDNPGAGTGPSTTFNGLVQPGKVVLTDALNHQTTFEIDRTGADHLQRVSKVTDALGRQRTAAYDASLNQTSLTGNTVAAVFSLTYDLNNNLSSFTSPSGNGTNTPASSSSTYTAPGQPFLPSSQTDSRGNCRSFAYDTAGNVTDVYDGQATPCSGLTGGTRLRNAYQGNPGVTCGGKPGALCSTTDGRGNVTSYAYDANGNLITVSPPIPLGQTTITPDSLGRPSVVVDGRGKATRFRYDKADRITRLLFDGATTCDGPHVNCIEYGYDADGNLTSRISNIGTTTYTYDNLGRLTKKAVPGPFVNACSGDNGMKLTYDAVGNVTSYCDARGTINYRFNNADEVISVQEPGGNCTVTPVTGACTLIDYVDSSGVYQDGRRTKVTYPPSTGVVMSMTYDRSGNLLSIVGKKGASTLSSFSYSYAIGTQDRAQRRSMTNTAGQLTTYQYDQFGRLCWIFLGSSSNSCGSPPTGSEALTHDLAGNRLTFRATNGTTTHYGYNAADQLCKTSTAGPPGCTGPTFSYDGNGNMTTSPRFSSLVYNAKDQNSARTLAGGSATSFAYADADQTERVSVGTLNLAYGPLGLAAESNTRFFTRDPTGSLIGMRNGTTNNYYLFDGLGSIVKIVDPNGAVVKEYGYDAFGKLTSNLSGVDSNLKYAAGYHDSPSDGLYQFGARFYDPDLGRWTQRDAFPGSIADPRRVNRYPYAGNDPVNFVDPTGTIDFRRIGQVITGVGTAAGGVGLIVLGVHTGHACLAAIALSRGLTAAVLGPLCIKAAGLAIGAGAGATVLGVEIARRGIRGR